MEVLKDLGHEGWELDQCCPNRKLMNWCSMTSVHPGVWYHSEATKLSINDSARHRSAILTPGPLLSPRSVVESVYDAADGPSGLYLCHRTRIDFRLFQCGVAEQLHHRGKAQACKGFGV